MCTETAYEKGNAALLAMFETQSFDPQVAERILIAYGGGSNESGRYPKPKLKEAIAESHLDEYAFTLFQCDDGYHLEGHLFDPDGIDIGTV